MKSANTDFKLRMPELSMGIVIVPESLEPEVLDNTSESGII